MVALKGLNRLHFCFLLGHDFSPELYKLRKYPMFLKGTTFRSYVKYCQQVRL